MKNSKFLKYFIGVVLTFITVLSFSSETFAMNISEAEMKKIRDSFEQAEPLEMAIKSCAFVL